MGERQVTMYARTVCGLCEKARDAILTVRAAVPFRYEEVFVDGREDLERAYGLRVPVVLVDGVEQFELDVDPGRLIALLTRGA
jgi:glutaredoxin-like protein DUF836